MGSEQILGELRKQVSTMKEKEKQVLEARKAVYEKNSLINQLSNKNNEMVADVGMKD